MGLEQRQRSASNQKGGISFFGKQNNSKQSQKKSQFAGPSNDSNKKSGSSKKLSGKDLYGLEEEKGYSFSGNRMPEEEEKKQSGFSNSY